MGAIDEEKTRTMRRICESVVATVTSGLIIWTVTNSIQKPSPAVGTAPVAAVPAVQPAVAANGPTLAPSPMRNTVQQVEAPLSVPTTPIQSLPVAPPSPTSVQPGAVPAGPILFYENFAHYREGEASGWGPNTLVRVGLDHRNWLVSNIDGTHPVGCRTPLPGVFSFECRYSTFMPEVTRGVLGWWKDPVATKVSFVNDQGVKYSIEWVVRFGNDAAQLNPLGSSSLYAKKYFHTIKLPDGATNEVALVQPTGMLRIDRDQNIIKVFVDGQAVATGTMNLVGQFVGFEIDVVKAKNGAMFFTDFKVAR